MKTFNNKFKLLTVSFIILLLVTTCIPKEESMRDAGQTLVKIYPPEYNKILFAPVATSQTAAVLEVRRDPGGQAALNSSTTVVLKFDQDTSMINKFNEKNGTYFSLLPVTLYTSDPAVAADGTVTVSIGPGEFVKSVMITVPNVFNFDFSQKYALAYKLDSVSGTGTKSLATSDTTVVEIGAQNAYEGLYHSVGYRDHPENGVYTIDDDKYLSTVDQYTVETYPGDVYLQGLGYILLITVDPNADLSKNVTVSSPNVVLYDNDPTVNARGIKGGYDHYDPLNKVFYLYYYYNSADPRVIQETITKK